MHGKMPISSTQMHGKMPISSFQIQMKTQDSVFRLFQSIFLKFCIKLVKIICELKYLSTFLLFFAEVANLLKPLAPIFQNRANGPKFRTFTTNRRNKLTISI